MDNRFSKPAHSRLFQFTAILKYAAVLADYLHGAIYRDRYALARFGALAPIALCDRHYPSTASIDSPLI